MYSLPKDIPVTKIPSRWNIVVWPGETFVDALVRCLTIEDLEFVCENLKASIAQSGRIIRKNLDGATPYVVKAAESSLPGVLAGRGIRKIEWGYSDNRYINAKWQYQMVLDVVCEALELKQFFVDRFE